MCQTQTNDVHVVNYRLATVYTRGRGQGLESAIEMRIESLGDSNPKSREFNSHLRYDDTWYLLRTGQLVDQADYVTAIIEIWVC